VPCRTAICCQNTDLPHESFAQVTTVFASPGSRNFGLVAGVGALRWVHAHSFEAFLACKAWHDLYAGGPLVSDGAVLQAKILPRSLSLAISSECWAVRPARAWRGVPGCLAAAGRR